MCRKMLKGALKSQNIYIFKDSEWIEGAWSQNLSNSSILAATLSTTVATTHAKFYFQSENVKDVM